MKKLGQPLLLSVISVFLLVIIASGCAVKKLAVTILRVEDYFMGEWEIKAVYVFQDNMSITGKAEAMSDHTFKAYWVQSLPPFDDNRTDFSGRWTLDERTNSLKLEYVVTNSGPGYKESDTATLKYKFVKSADAGFTSLILSVSAMDMLVERAGLEGMSTEELMKEINSLPQDQREDLERLLVKIILEQKPGGR